MAVTGRQLLDFVNAHGDDEKGVCQCGHWWEEHHDGTCDACLENAFDQYDPHAVADHAFVYSDEATAESEYLNERARELGFVFETIEDGDHCRHPRNLPAGFKAGRQLVEMFVTAFTPPLWECDPFPIDTSPPGRRIPADFEKRGLSSKDEGEGGGTNGMVLDGPCDCYRAILDYRVKRNACYRFGASFLQFEDRSLLG